MRVCALPETVHGSTTAAFSCPCSLTSAAVLSSSAAVPVSPCVRACVRACVRVCRVCVRVRACVCVCARRARRRSACELTTMPLFRCPLLPERARAARRFKVATAGLQRRVETRAHLHVDARVVLGALLERVAVEMVRAAIAPRSCPRRRGEATLGRVHRARKAESGRGALKADATRAWTVCAWTRISTV